MDVKNDTFGGWTIGFRRHSGWKIGTDRRAGRVDVSLSALSTIGSADGIGGRRISMRSLRLESSMLGRAI
jgi:hypothetical protein